MLIFKLLLADVTILSSTECVLAGAYLVARFLYGRTCALLLCIVMAATRHYYSYHHYIFTSKALAQHLLSGYVVLHSLFNLVSLFYVVYLVQGHYLFTKSGRRECIYFVYLKPSHGLIGGLIVFTRH